MPGRIRGRCRGVWTPWAGLHIWGRQMDQSARQRTTLDHSSLFSSKLCILRGYTMTSRPYTDIWEKQVNTGAHQFMVLSMCLLYSLMVWHAKAASWICVHERWCGQLCIMPMAQDPMHSGHWSYPQSHLNSENTTAFVESVYSWWGYSKRSNQAQRRTFA